MRNLEDVLRVASKGNVEVALEFANEVKRFRLREAWDKSESEAYDTYDETFYKYVPVLDEENVEIGTGRVLIDPDQTPLTREEWDVDRQPYEEPESVVLDTDLKEAIRKAHQARRDFLLMTNTVEVGGKVFDYRPVDEMNYRKKIEAGIDREWILKDNSIAFVTVDELKEVERLGEIALTEIYDSYIAKTKAI